MPITSFYKRKDGTPRSWCKECNKETAKEFYKNNPEYQRNKSKEWRDKNHEKVVKYRTKNKKKEHRNSIKRKYGVSIEWFDETLKNQNNKCAICKKELTWDDKQNTPHVDHCHDSGIVREILCNRCNSILGICKEQEDILYNALKYLEKWHGISAKL